MSSLALVPSLLRPASRWTRLSTDTALVAGGVLIVSTLAQVAIPLPGTPVPLTGQTLGVLLVAAALGAPRAVATMATYLLIGAAGAPVFAHHTSGFDVLRLSSSTGGYLVGMLVAAALVGHLADRGLDRRAWTVLPTMVLGNVVIYAFGATWLAHALGLDVATALRLGVRPFLIGDAVKLLLATLALPAGWRLVRSTQDRHTDE